VAGSSRAARFFRVLLALVMAGLIVTVLMTTNIWSPLPYLNELVDKLTQISEPEPAWTERIEGRPDVVGLANEHVIVASRGFVFSFRARDGRKVWQKPVHWAFPAGEVVVAQPRPGDPDADPSPDRGYEVLNPASGRATWSDLEAIAVWVYDDEIVDLVCPDEEQCLLRDRAHADGDIRWSVALPGSARTIRGANPRLATVRDPAGWFSRAAAGAAPSIPTVMPLVFDDRVVAVDTSRRQVVAQATAPDRETRVTFLGDRMLFVRAERADAGCHFRVEAFDVGSGSSVWVENGFDLDTARGAGCEQREDPVGGGSKLVVNGSDARPMLVNADLADRIWTGAPGARVLATDGLLAVVVGPDRQTVSGLDAVTPESRTVWSGELGLDPQAAITDEMVILRDADRGRLFVLDRNVTPLRQVLELKTKAEIAGYGSDAIVLASGRSIGYVPVELLSPA
jgi:hypothetical protein